jgi:hypothetical protein
MREREATSIKAPGVIFIVFLEKKEKALALGLKEVRLQ